MQGKIQLRDFIELVKREVIDSQLQNNSHCTLEAVDIEATFVLEASNEAGGQLFVEEMDGSSSGKQTHKLKLKLKPIQTQSTHAEIIDVGNMEYEDLVFKAPFVEIEDIL